MASAAPKLTGWKCCKEECRAVTTFDEIHGWSLDDPDLCSHCGFRYCEHCTDLDEQGHAWTGNYAPREVMRKKCNGELENHLFWNCCQVRVTSSPFPISSITDQRRLMTKPIAQCQSWNLTSEQDISDYKNGDIDKVQCSADGCGSYFCPLCTLSTVYHSNEEGDERFDPAYDGDRDLKETQFFDGCNARSASGDLEHSADNRRCWLLANYGCYRSFHRQEPWRGPMHAGR